MNTKTSEFEYTQNGTQTPGPREPTAWGLWVESQPKGVLMDCVRKTGLSWATVNKARWNLVLGKTARELSLFSRGAVRARDIAKPAPKGRKRKARKDG